MSFPNIINASYSTQEHRADTADKFHALGQRMEYEDGRKFRYVLAGGVTLVVADLIEGKNNLAGDDDLVVQANWAVGDTTGTITSASSTAAAYYDGGWMMTSNAPGMGYAYRVKTQVLWASTTETIILDIDDPIRVALTTSTEVGFAPLPWNGVIQGATTPKSGLVGVAVTPITTLQYGWVQSGGVCPVHGAGGVLGENYDSILSTAGRAGVGADNISEQFGIVMIICDDAGDTALVDLRID